MSTAPNMICPKCGLFQPRAQVCSGCGVVPAKLAQGQAPVVDQHGHPRAVAPVHGVRTRSVQEDVVAWLRRRFPFVFSYFDALDRFRHAAESIAPIAPFRKGLAVLALCGLVLVVLSRVSLSRAEHELVYNTEGPVVRCGTGVTACEAVYHVALGNLGQQTMGGIEIELHYGRFVDNVDVTRQGFGLLNRHVVSIRNGEINRVAAQSAKGLAADVSEPGTKIDSSDNPERDFRMHEARLTALDREARSRARRFPSAVSKQATTVFRVGRLLSTQSERFQLNLWFERESDVLPWSEILARVTSPKGVVYEGRPHLGLFGRFLMALGI